VVHASRRGGRVSIFKSRKGSFVWCRKELKKLDLPGTPPSRAKLAMPHLQVIVTNDGLDLLVLGLVQVVDPNLRREHGLVDGVVGEVLLAHPDDAHAERDVSNPSEVVVGLAGVIGVIGTEIPDLRHTPGGTTSSEDLKHPLEEETEHESANLNKVEQAGRDLSRCVIGPGFDPVLWAHNGVFQRGVGGVSEEHADEAKDKNNVGRDAEVVVRPNRVARGAAAQVPDLTHTPDSTTSAKDL